MRAGLRVFVFQEGRTAASEGNESREEDAKTVKAARSERPMLVYKKTRTHTQTRNGEGRGRGVGREEGKSEGG